MFLSKELDLRVPIDLTLRELVQIVIDAYGVNVKVQNPSARNKQTGEILSSTSLLGLVRDGALLELENV
ncbi:type VII secretion protein [Streptococcus agalactiae]|uniref:type VII secretion protein n=1 Tax=Streptococcus hyovaginalis TaxID=149015 RepID=UPI001E3A4FBA